MGIKIKHDKSWEKVEILGGGWIKVRAEGGEYGRKLWAALTNFKAEKGLKDNDLLPQLDFRRLQLESAIGTTFLGFGDFVLEDGTPLADRDVDGLNVEACLAVLDIDEVFDAWITTKSRLTTARDDRWTAAAKNSQEPSTGTASGGPTSAPN